MVNQAISWS